MAMTLQDIGTRRREWIAEARVYLVIDAWPHGESPEPILRAALQNGVDIIQLREQSLEPAQIVQASRVFRRLCDAYDALFIVNDRPDLALVCGADGVHLGQRDPDAAQARRFVGPDLLIGRSTIDTDQIDLAAADRAIDYLAIGHIDLSADQLDGADAHADLLAHAAAVAKPFFAAGGLNAANLGSVLTAGATRAIVAGAITDAADPSAAATEFRTALVGQTVSA
jgi:thiamine-phosphate pyrophosphorylase